jgi:hypothetical protein
MKVPLVALSCRHVLAGGVRTSTVLPTSELAPYLFPDYLNVVPVTSRFTIPFLFRQWHFAAAADQQLYLPDLDITEESINASPYDSRRVWGTSESTGIRYFRGDETNYRLGNNNVLFDLRFSFYPSQH